MEISTLSIPEPTSSKLALEQKRIQLKESRAELKRKLSKISFEDQPFEYRKLRIEDLEVQVEEERFHKSGIDHEHQQRQMNDSGSRKAHRETNKRIVSLGSELWKENEQLRMQEELAGKVPKLGPDSKGAFVQTLLALYKNPNVSHKRSSSLQSHKRQLFQFTKPAKGRHSKGRSGAASVRAISTRTMFESLT